MASISGSFDNLSDDASSRSSTFDKALDKVIDRQPSMATIGGYETATEDDEEQDLDHDDDFADAEDNEVNTLSETATKDGTIHTVQHHPSRAASEIIQVPISESASASASASSQRIASGSSQPLSGLSQFPETPQQTRRPRLHSRFASARSSYSSRTSEQASEDDYAIGADYALQTGGGALLSSSTSSRPSQDLMRSISLASIASGITDPNAKRNISTASDMHDDDRMPTPKPRDDISFVDTPTKANHSPGLKTPTASQFERHIAKLTVPETPESEFQHVADTSPGTLGASPLNARIQSLALKEQGNIVDKLQKENFKLKMKLYYLEKRLAQVTDEEVKRMINENIELSTYKISAGKEIRALNKTNRDLQYQLNERDARLEAYQRAEKSEEELHSYRSVNDQELQWMRERISTYEVSIHTLNDRFEESQARAQNLEVEKQQLHDMVNSMSASRTKTDNIELKEEIDLWKDLAEAEAARKEQTIEENRKLREEVSTLKATKDTRRFITEPARPTTSSGDRSKSASSGQTLVEMENLRYENAELRREVGAQTSMLRSRNREREKLYLEIEDLKMGMRQQGGRSTTGDSIFERSASRAVARDDNHSGSQNRSIGMSESDREALEIQNGELRDNLSLVKMENQELSKQVETLATELERLADIEDEKAKLQRDYNDLDEQTGQELLAVQAEKDEAWSKHDDVLQAFEELREEAQERISTLDDEVEQREQRIAQLEREINNHMEDNDSLHNEVRMIREGLEKIETDNQNKVERIKELDVEIEELNKELESMESAQKETTDKHEKLSIELESRQSEVVFLREEQDTYIIRIAELEASMKTAQTGLESEQKRNSELGRRLTEERSQHQAIGSQEKKETSRMINDLNREVTRAREEALKLQKAINIKESEVKTWKDRLFELEYGLREILGDKLTTKNGFVSTITQMQRSVEQLTDELAMAKHTLALKEQALRRRDTLLENSAMESSRLSDQLEKERSARSAERAAHEHWQQTHRHTSDTINVRNSRITELENQRQADRRKLGVLEAALKEQLAARNEILLNLWHRLAALCGTDWQNANSLVAGHLPTLEVVSSKLPGFSKNLMLALKTVESMIGGFRHKIRSIEKELTKEYSDLERAMDVRTKRLDRLESQAQLANLNANANASGAGVMDESRWVFRLKELERRLKAEREGRILDRNGARQRLAELERGKEALSQRLSVAEAKYRSVTG